jgi:hypothetical protein
MILCARTSAAGNDLIDHRSWPAHRKKRPSEREMGSPTNTSGCERNHGARCVIGLLGLAERGTTTRFITT